MAITNSIKNINITIINQGYIKYNDVILILYKNNLINYIKYKILKLMYETIN